VIDEHQPHDDDAPARPRAMPHRKYPWAIVVVVILFVIIPFVSWYGTWFGRPLSDEKIEQYLNDTEKPRNAQHALAQVADRIIKGDQSVKRWYPAVIAAAAHSTPQVRLTAAWVMGQDNSHQEFHSALLPLLGDPHPGVRHNAALALVRFGDATGRPELVAMLKPYTVRAERDGSAEIIVEEEGAAVAEGSPLARITQADGQRSEVFAPEDARIETVAVRDGAQVRAGSELMVLSPAIAQVENALLALALVGREEDIPHIQRYAQAVTGMPDYIRQRANQTIERIRSRAAGYGAQ
jgi:HEAT repeat protein